VKYFHLTAIALLAVLVLTMTSADAFTPPNGPNYLYPDTKAEFEATGRDGDDFDPTYDGADYPNGIPCEFDSPFGLEVDLPQPYSPDWWSQGTDDRYYCGQQSTAVGTRFLSFAPDIWIDGEAVGGTYIEFEIVGHRPNGMPKYKAVGTGRWGAM
jgi:hypothetical protein